MLSEPFQREEVKGSPVVPGIRTIRDRISVRYPETITIPSDSEIEGRAIKRLDWDPDVDVRDLIVSVENGEVTLEGTVDAFWKKLHAERQIQDLVGVIAVENKLGVVPSDRITDQMVAENIIDKLDANILIDPNTLDVEVDNGHVNLSGTVTSYSARNAAHNAALFTEGVRSVTNDLIILA